MMLTVPPPMSNTERQRKFRQGNPGYYARIQATRRAAARADAARFVAALATAATVDSSVETQSVQFTAEAPTSC